MWLFWGLVFGYFSGAVARASQYWGAGNVHRVRNVLGLDFLVGALAGILTVASDIPSRTSARMAVFARTGCNRLWC